MQSLIFPREAIHRGNLILVNAQYPFRAEFAQPVLQPVNLKSSVMLEQTAAASLARAVEESAGWDAFCAVSGWRSFDEQQAIYTRSLAENGAAFTRQFVALPGHSEHQTGLAIDLGLNQEPLDFIRPAFPCTGICARFRTNCVSHGFVERYPKGKEPVTGIAHEPWHFRYLGSPHARILTDWGYCLEEYIEFLRQFSAQCPYVVRDESGEYGIYFVKAGSGNTEIPVTDPARCRVSGNNVDGFVVTERRLP